MTGRFGTKIAKTGGTPALDASKIRKDVSAIAPTKDAHASAAATQADPHTTAPSRTSTAVPGAFSRRLKAPDPTKRPVVENGFWWTFDAATKVFRHRIFGEEIRYIGPVTVDGASGVWPWFRFDYVSEAEGAWYPLLVQVKTAQPEPYGGINQWIDWERAGLVEYEERHAFPKSSFRFWRVDHDRSLTLWQEDCGFADELPPYGLWRRADLAIISAALCLPPVALIGSAPEMVALNGGWLNGEWRSGFYRRATYSWHRASGADKCAFTPAGKMRPEAIRDQFFPDLQAARIPIYSSCPTWRPGEIQVFWQEPRQNDQVRVVACMQEQRTGELLYASSWHSVDPVTTKESWALDLHYSGFGIVVRDMTDFRYRPAELVLADPINISQDFSMCDYVHSIAAPSRPKFVSVFDLDLAKSLIPDLKVSAHQLGAEAVHGAEDIAPWRTIRNKPFGSYRWCFALHEALMHGLPFSPGFDLGASVRKSILGQRATFDIKSGEIGCSWLYETTMRLELRLPSDGEGPGWEPLFD